MLAMTQSLRKILLIKGHFVSFLVRRYGQQELDNRWKICLKPVHTLQTVLSWNVPEMENNVFRGHSTKLQSTIFIRCMPLTRRLVNAMYLGSLSLTWFNVNLIMDESSPPQYSFGWNYLSTPNRKKKYHCTWIWSWNFWYVETALKTPSIITSNVARPSALLLMKPCLFFKHFISKYYWTDVDVQLNCIWKPFTCVYSSILLMLMRSDHSAYTRNILQL